MESLWFPLKFWDEKQLAQFREFAKKRLDYREVQPLFASDKMLEENIIQLAAAFMMFDHQPLDKKLEKLSRYNSKSLKRFRSKVLDMASEIQRINTLPLPGAATATQLIWDLGREDISPYLAPGTESLQDLALDVERLPHVLREYAETLRSWPHPSYRENFSDRNWEARPLALLHALVQAVHQEPLYEKIAVLLTIVRDFAAEKLNRPPRRRGRPSEGDATANSLPEGAVVDGAAVRRTLFNFKDRNPDVWSRIRRRAAIAAERRLEEFNANAPPTAGSGPGSETEAPK